MACRELIDWGIVRTERQAGSRRVAYLAEDDPLTVVRGIVKARKRREWDPLLDHSHAWLDRLDRGSAGDGALLRRRLEGIEGIVRQVDSMAESFLGGGIVANLGLKTLIAKARRSKRR